jgi:hypothetical protein
MGGIIVGWIDGYGAGARAAVTHGNGTGVGVTNDAVAIGVSGQAKSQADDGLLVEAIGGADARNKVTVANLEPCAFRVAIHAADFDVVCLRQVGMEDIRSGVVFVRRRIVFIADAISKSELGSHGPLILSVDANRSPAKRVWIKRLLGFGDS